MIAPKTILVATDFGEAAQTALAYGRALAHTFGASLHLLHVRENVFLRPITGDPHALHESAVRNVNDSLTPDDRRLLRARAAVEVSDDPAAAIAEYARTAGIDLIVTGTNGRTGLEHALVGSVAERVVRTAPCPVLTVRRHEREFVLPDVPDACPEADNACF